MEDITPSDFPEPLPRTPIKKSSIKKIYKSPTKPPYHEAYEGSSESKPNSERWTNILYPYKLLEAYHDVRVCGKYVSEAECDKLLNVFMESNDKKAYLQQFKQSITPRIFKIIMNRVLVGTFLEDRNKSSVSPAYRSDACEFLGVSDNIKCFEAMRRLEEANALASHEEMILGRIGYLMIWKSGISLDNMIPENYQLPG